MVTNNTGSVADGFHTHQHTAPAIIRPWSLPNGKLALPELMKVAEEVVLHHYASHPAAKLAERVLLAFGEYSAEVEVPSYTDQQRQRLIQCSWLPKLLLSSKPLAAVYVAPWTALAVDNVVSSQHASDARVGHEVGVLLAGRSRLGHESSAEMFFDQCADQPNSWRHAASNTELFSDGVWERAMSWALESWRPDWRSHSLAPWVLSSIFDTEDQRDRARVELYDVTSSYPFSTTVSRADDGRFEMANMPSNICDLPAMTEVLSEYGSRAWPEEGQIRYTLISACIEDPLRHVGVSEEQARWDVCAESDLGEHCEQVLSSLPPHRDVWDPVQRVGRNEPCPCGSGIKFKKCCAT